MKTILAWVAFGILAWSVFRLVEVGDVYLAGGVGAIAVFFLILAIVFTWGER